MTQPLRLSQQLATDLSAVNPFVELIGQQVQGFVGSGTPLFHVKLALEEALTNAMRHGNRLDSRLQVTVTIEADSRMLVMDIHDQGCGFDHKSLPDPTTAANSSRPSGRGVYLMRTLMDTVEFYDAGSGVRMTKRLDAPS